MTTLAQGAFTFPAVRAGRPVPSGAPTFPVQAVPALGSLADTETWGGLFPVFPGGPSIDGAFGGPPFLTVSA